MGARIRAFDWSSGPLGAPGLWPQALKTSIRLMLTTRHPVLIFWGRDFITFYNDSFSNSLGSEKHPAMLGAPGRAMWREVWPIVGADLESVMAGSGATWREDQLVPILRHGKMDEVYWTYSYSPIDHDGGVGGVLVLCTETTKNVLESRQRQVERDRQQRLFEQAPGFIIIMRGPGHVVEFVNNAHRAVFGSQDWLGKSIRAAFPSIAGQGFFERLDEVYRTGETFEARGAEVRYRRSPSMPEETRYLTFIYAPLHGEDGSISGIFCEGFDVTEAHRAERRGKALAELGDRIRQIDDPDDLAYAAAEILGRELAVSRAGYGTIDTANETIRIDRDWSAPGVKSLAGLLHFRDYGSYIEDLIRGETVVCADARTDPRTEPTAGALAAIDALSFVNMPITEQGGFVALLFLNDAAPREWVEDEIGFIREVAERTRTAVERRRAEASLRENEARLRFLDALARETGRSTDADAIMAATTRMLGRYLDVAVCAYADMDSDEDGFTIRGDWSAPGSESIVGHYSLAAFGKLAVRNLHAGVPLVTNDNLAELAPEEAATFLGIGLAATICMPLVKEGRLTALMAVHSAVPRVWSLDELALLREVTERSWAHIERVRSEAAAQLSEQQFRAELEAKVAERTAALQQSEARIRTIFATSHLFQGLIDPAGTLLDANATSLAAIEANREDVIGKPYWETPWFSGTPGMSEAVRAGVARAASGSTETRSITISLPTGIRSFDFSMRPVRNDAGEVVAVVPEAIETTARIRTELALQQAQKMEAIGNLTGGVAHDFNNLLMAVFGSLELLRKRMPNDPALLRLLDNAMDGARRGSSLTQRMLAFARRQELKSERVSLKQLVGGMTELLQRSLGPMIAVETDFSDELPAVEADPNQLESALLNLAVNARDAMHGDGRDHHFGSRGAGRESRGEAAPGPLCLPVDLRQRRRHGRGHAQAGRGAVFHDEGDRQGHGARSLDGTRPRRAVRRDAGPQEHAGLGHDGRDLAAGPEPVSARTRAGASATSRGNAAARGGETADDPRRRRRCARSHEHRRHAGGPRA